MRDLTAEELGHVYGAGSYGKPTKGRGKHGSKSRSKSRSKSKNHHKPRYPKY